LRVPGCRAQVQSDKEGQQRKASCAKAVEHTVPAKAKLPSPSSGMAKSGELEARRLLAHTHRFSPQLCFFGAKPGKHENSRFGFEGCLFCDGV
jgi:hypothetical protein